MDARKCHLVHIEPALGREGVVPRDPAVHDVRRLSERAALRGRQGREAARTQEGKDAQSQSLRAVCLPGARARTDPDARPERLWERCGPLCEIMLV